MATREEVVAERVGNVRSDSEEMLMAQDSDVGQVVDLEWSFYFWFLCLDFPPSLQCISKVTEETTSVICTLCRFDSVDLFQRRRICGDTFDNTLAVS